MEALVGDNAGTANVTYDDIVWLRANSPAWRLLRADSGPLVLSFLHRVFVADNVRSIAAVELASRLDDEVYALNERTPKSSVICLAQDGDDVLTSDPADLQALARAAGVHVDLISVLARTCASKVQGAHRQLHDGPLAIGN
jgi:Protein of unknown function (DUF3375)